jgi:hypothetical protein
MSRSTDLSRLLKRYRSLLRHLAGARTLQQVQASQAELQTLHSSLSAAAPDTDPQSKTSEELLLLLLAAQRKCLLLLNQHADAAAAAAAAAAA